MTSAKRPNASYQELNDELQELLARLEDGNIDIDEAVSCYERGLEIIRLLEAQLAKAENRVDILQQSQAKATE